jgi:hypothetical protein
VKENVSRMPYAPTKMEATGIQYNTIDEGSVFLQNADTCLPPTQSHILGHHNLHTHFCENLEAQILDF